jgi:hypothetical protein
MEAGEVDGREVLMVMVMVHARNGSLRLLNCNNCVGLVGWLVSERNVCTLCVDSEFVVTAKLHSKSDQEVLGVVYFNLVLLLV